jgi:hypothetical protein
MAARSSFPRGVFTDLEDGSNNGHGPVLSTSLLLLLLHFGDASASLLVRDICTANVRLARPHASVDINILCSDEQRAIRWSVEPTVGLPAQVEGDEERTSEVQFEEGLRVQVGASDRIQRSVELCHEAEDVDKHAHIGAPNTEGGLEGQFIQAMTIGEPTNGLVTEKSSDGAVWSLPGRAEADMSKSSSAVDEEDGKT